MELFNARNTYRSQNKYDSENQEIQQCQVMQLKEKDKSRALTLRECGRTQARVAEYLDVNVRTIQRLEERSKKLKKGEIPQR